VPLPRWLRHLVPAGPVGRTAGPPPSPNGASSLHLFWMLAGEVVEVRATLEVLEPPTVDRLFFWALQASFSDRGRITGGAHLGLQHHPAYPGGGAVNWGGYAAGGRELTGSASALPSVLGNPNTRDLAWRPRTAYGLRIHRSPQRGWRGTVVDPAAGPVAVRDLWVDGDALVSPVVWSEVFADCDHPAAAVRWSGLVGIDADGGEVRPSGLRVNYQAHDAGGCANTVSAPDGVGIVQRTATTRTVAQGSVLTAV
jgi:hypothetical protein